MTMMTVQEYQNQLDELLDGMSIAQLHVSPDFLCNQTEGFPTVLCVLWDQGKAWIDKYTGIEAKIINRTGGMVDRTVFRFADIIGMKQTPLCGKHEPYIWVYHDETVCWYTPVSDAEKQRIADAVMAYVELYQTPQQGPDMKM